MSLRIKIKNLSKEYLGKPLKVYGWIRTTRTQKTFSFIEINDGSTLSNLQVVLDETLPGYSTLLHELTTGAALGIHGVLVESPGAKQAFELKASLVEILGTCPADSYPLQKKRHSFEFLRTLAHLRPRTNTQGAVLRIRNALAFATHEFFQKRDFLYVQTPIITASDCEGAGEQFLVTTLDYNKLLTTRQSEIDYGSDFFGKKAYLTVSGQLNLETVACAMGDVYTFGPTFRAENSNTSRHLSEFWMIEPEMAFATLSDNMECAESFLKYLIQYVLTHAKEDMLFFDTFIEKGLIERLQKVLHSSFTHLSYTEAITILENAKITFTFPVGWGLDLQSEHERYLCEQHIQGPIIITDYPRQIKAFYMRDNSDGKTVAAMDVLVPHVGEIIGGSQREERLDLLEKKLLEFKLDPQTYNWYLDIRRYGSVPHAGFGAGFERLVQFITGMENIRDVIPFPRFPGHAEF